jgi:hypothetical protein
MLLTRSNFMPFLNRPIALHLADGTTRRGILHSVSDDGVYLRPISSTRLATGDEVKLLGDLEKSEDIQEAFFPFFFFLPFFFLPFFFIRRRFFI